LRSMRSISGDASNMASELFGESIKFSGKFGLLQGNMAVSRLKKLLSP
jgi:hypothetical protein